MARSGPSLRELRGLAIVALGGQIERISDTVFAVKSQSSPGAFHRVEWKNGKWFCDCVDYAKRRKPCKHIYAVNFLLDLPRILLSNSGAFRRTCRYCGSPNVSPKGFRHNKDGPVKLYICKSCGRRFKEENSPLGSAKDALALIAADLYFKGLSIRDIKNHLWQVYGVDKSAATIHRWVTKIARALKEIAEKFEIKVGDKWLADETVVKINGEPKYLWSIMDSETRAYIVSLITSGRSTEDAKAAIEAAIKNAGKIPKTLITDGLKSYEKAMGLLGLPIEHVGNAGLAKAVNNNVIERLHGTVKEWIKRKRSPKEGLPELIEVYKAYYNHIRPNMALGEKTPANKEAKWLTMLSKNNSETDQA